MRRPFDGNFPQTQRFNDLRFRASYIQFGILGHNGEDYGLPQGTEVLAPHDGIVKEVVDEGNVGYGKYIKIESELEGSVLAHLSVFNVSQGQQVKEGDFVARSGNTGNSTGPHLHWGYYRTRTRNRQNGFLGYIDQTDWLDFKQMLFVLTDQTKIPSIDNMEVQAIRSTIGDLRRSLVNCADAYDQERESHYKTLEELKKCQNVLKAEAVMSYNSPKTASLKEVIQSIIKKLFG